MALYIKDYLKAKRQGGKGKKRGINLDLQRSTVNKIIVPIICCRKHLFCRQMDRNLIVYPCTMH